MDDDFFNFEQLEESDDFGDFIEGSNTLVTDFLSDREDSKFKSVEIPCHTNKQANEFDDQMRLHMTKRNVVSHRKGSRGSAKTKKREKKAYSKSGRDAVVNWLLEHSNNPYPSAELKNFWCLKFRFSPATLNVLLTNSRRRYISKFYK
jgi:hypothetical protein